MSEAVSPLIVPTIGPRPRGRAEMPDALGERLGSRIRGLLKRSLHVRHLDSGSCNGCDWEIQALLGPVYDIQRLGIDIVASPRHADMVVNLLLFWPQVGVSVKRWHDRNKSGWWVLIALVPFVGWVWVLVENGFLRGDAGANRFGDPPSQERLPRQA